MTVGELIDFLQHLPAECEVLIDDLANGQAFNLDRVVLEKDLVYLQGGGWR